MSTWTCYIAPARAIEMYLKEWQHEKQRLSIRKNICSIFVNFVYYGTT
jgi:hypothetical protein